MHVVHLGHSALGDRLPLQCGHAAIKHKHGMDVVVHELRRGWVTDRANTRDIYDCSPAGHTPTHPADAAQNAQNVRVRLEIALLISHRLQEAGEPDGDVYGQALGGGHTRLALPTPHS